MQNDLDLDDILSNKDQAPAYVVENWIYEGQIVVLAGEPGTGKSFLMYSLALAITTNQRFLEMQTKHGPVLYFDEENGRPDLGEYLRWAWRAANKPDIANLKELLHIKHFALSSRGHTRFETMSKAAAEVKPCLIVIDTANPVCGIEKEDSNDEAREAIKELRQVQRAAGRESAMVILKHTKFTHDSNEQRTIRGAKTWLNELDGVMYHVRVPGGKRIDGLRDSQLIPDKVRAYGMRIPLKIHPSWSGSEAEKSLVLHRV